MKVTIEKHTSVDKFFDFNVEDELCMRVENDDVDHATVDAMVETCAEAIRKHFDYDLFETKQREFQKKRWDSDKDLREDYDNDFDAFYNSISRKFKRPKASQEFNASAASKISDDKVRKEDDVQYAVIIDAIKKIAESGGKSYSYSPYPMRDNVKQRLLDAGFTVADPTDANRGEETKIIWK